MSKTTHTTVTTTETRRSTTQTVRVRCVCKVDNSFPCSPAGILKIIEMVLGVIMLAMVAWGRNVYAVVQDSTPSLSQLLTIASETRSFYTPALAFCLAAVIIAWLLTILFFFLFLFCVPEQCGGNFVWNVLDMVFIVFWVLFYLITFILLCVACGKPTDHSVVYSAGLIAGIIFALLQLIAYVLSLFFCVMAYKGKALY